MTLEAISDWGCATSGHSPCEVTRDGLTVKIQIYRGPIDPGWLLEVVDHEGGSTVWQDPFASDHAALDEAMQTLATDGIRSFTTSA